MGVTVADLIHPIIVSSETLFIILSRCKTFGLDILDGGVKMENAKNRAKLGNTLTISHVVCSGFMLCGDNCVKAPYQYIRYAISPNCFRDLCHISELC